MVNLSIWVYALQLGMDLQCTYMSLQLMEYAMEIRLVKNILILEQCRSTHRGDAPIASPPPFFSQIVSLDVIVIVSYNMCLEDLRQPSHLPLKKIATAL